MKKLCMVVVFITLVGFLAFGDAADVPNGIEPVDLWGGNTDENASPEFPWWRFPLLLMGILIFTAILHVASRGRRRLTNEEKTCILTKEEICQHAFQRYQQRYFQTGIADIDWYRAIYELSTHYEAEGYRVIFYWQAKNLPDETRNCRLCA